MLWMYLFHELSNKYVEKLPNAKRIKLLTSVEIAMVVWYELYRDWQTP